MKRAFYQTECMMITCYEELIKIFNRAWRAAGGELEGGYSYEEFSDDSWEENEEKEMKKTENT